MRLTSYTWVLLGVLCLTPITSSIHPEPFHPLDTTPGKWKRGLSASSFQLKDHSQF